MAGNSVKAVPVALLNAAGLTGGFDVINAAGLPQSCFRIRISNLTNVGIGISFDGVTLHDGLKVGDVLDFPAQQNARGPGYVANFKKGLKIYAVSAAPGIGFIYLAGYYQ
jgi:hypothetical protein